MIGSEERTVVVSVFGIDLTIIYDIAWITCDREGCEARHVVQSRANDGAWEPAKRLGWTWVSGNVDRCPLHPIVAPVE